MQHTVTPMQATEPDIADFARRVRETEQSADPALPRICGRCERPIAPYIARGSGLYRRGDQCACTRPERVLISEGSRHLFVLENTDAEASIVQHRVSIPAQAGPGGYAYLARCSCGWMDSLARGTREDAESAAAEHVAAAEGRS